MQRHIGPAASEQQRMLEALGYRDLDAFLADVVPDAILDASAPTGVLPPGCDEATALQDLRAIGAANQVRRSLIGLGYYGTAVPAVIQRHVFENPAWYTAYTYQAEIAQGRLEVLLNFQTLISELTGLPIANASLLDEATAAAEAMALSDAVCRRADARRFLVDAAVLPQTYAVLETRAQPLGIQLERVDLTSVSLDEQVFGVLVQLPGADGDLWDPSELIARAHGVGALVTVAIDPLAQTLIAPVADFGADTPLAVPSVSGCRWGSAVPMPLTKEAYKRQIPGRLVGRHAMRKVSRRCAWPCRPVSSTSAATRPPATSAPLVLLAVMASFYAVHHGPDGLSGIAMIVGSGCSWKRRSRHWATRWSTAAASTPSRFRLIGPPRSIVWPSRPDSTCGCCPMVQRLIRPQVSASASTNAPMPKN